MKNNSGSKAKSKNIVHKKQVKSVELDSTNNNCNNIYSKDVKSYKNNNLDSDLQNSKLNNHFKFFLKIN